MTSEEWKEIFFNKLENAFDFRMSVKDTLEVSRKSWDDCVGEIIKIELEKEMTALKEDLARKSFSTHCAKVVDEKINNLKQ